MWRKRVYCGTLRPKDTDSVTAQYLSDLLDHLTLSVKTNNYGYNTFDEHDVTEIIDGLYLGAMYAAQDKRFLTKYCFTHILNSAEGTDSLQVDTNADYYRNMKITYLGIPGHDRPTWDIAQYFQQTSKFIDDALKSGGKVLVHCVMGISRSATLVIAYLMIYRGMSVVQAITHVFQRRRINPNMGFLEDLAQLNFKLKNRM